MLLYESASRRPLWLGHFPFRKLPLRDQKSAPLLQHIITICCKVSLFLNSNSVDASLQEYSNNMVRPSHLMWGSKIAATSFYEWSHYQSCSFNKMASTLIWLNPLWFSALELAQNIKYIEDKVYRNLPDLKNQNLLTVCTQHRSRSIIRRCGSCCNTASRIGPAAK